MRSIRRSIASVGAILLLIGCDGLGINGTDERPQTDEVERIGDFSDVSVIAKIDPTASAIGFTIQNGSSETIFVDRSAQAIGLQRLDDGECRTLGPTQQMIDGADVPVPIESGEDFTGDTKIEGGPVRITPGEYRYQLTLTDEDGELLPDKARTSNTVRIE